MWVPVLHGLIDRRILVNYRVDPDVMQRCLPPPFRVQRVNGYGVAGICLIRMVNLRPWFLPFPVLRRSENGALRFAVEWEHGGRHHTGVYIPERFSNSSFVTLTGGRFFPGVHHKAQFHVVENGDDYLVEMRSRLNLSIQGRAAGEWSGSALFESPDAASRFFRDASLGYSDALGGGGKYEGLELRIADWAARPLRVERVSCDFFDDPKRFPPGTATFDNALLMRGLRNEFHGRGSFCCDAGATGRTAALAAAR